MILLGPGAWVALVDRSRPQHTECVRALKDLSEPLASVWPVVSEALNALSEVPKGQDVVWEMIERGAVELLTLDEADVGPIRELMRRHADRRMSLADAALVHVAEREGIRTIFTIRGKEFGAYKLSSSRKLKVIP
jgi:predicted nucleic acid-binding protein